eukprot:comp26018_c0_seq1/m.61951 comp26018_c0_seq1/g.61951  ORF comp26018_c0_seq1/g.61951 comp26018_c0_seq1/m.61951 type:complete len:269 (+) comp26018_c0_seq1:21-827(+)
MIDLVFGGSPKVFLVIEEVLKQPGGRSSLYKVIQYTCQLSAVFFLHRHNTRVRSHTTTGAIESEAVIPPTPESIVAAVENDKRADARAEDRDQHIARKLKLIGKIMSKSRYALRLGGFISPLVLMLEGWRDLGKYEFAMNILDTVSELFDNLVGINTLGLWDPGDDAVEHFERFSDTAWFVSCTLNFLRNLSTLRYLLRKRKFTLAEHASLARALIKGLTDIYMSFIWAFSVENHPPWLFQSAGLVTSSIQLYNGWLSAGLAVSHQHK